MRYIVIDLEMCNVPKTKRTEYEYKLEIIQIGAVKLDDNYEIIDKFSTYVSPVYGQLDRTIRKLTGIVESDLKDAPNLTKALDDFFEWAGEEDYVIVSWSHSDDGQFKHEFECKNMNDERIENLYPTWIDAQKMFSKIAKIDRSTSLEEALIASDIYQEGRAHDGLTDAYNTAVLFRKMKTEKEFTFNRDYYAAKYSEPEHLGVSMSSLFANIKLDQ